MVGEPMVDSNDQLVLLRLQMERIRQELYRALDAAGGRQSDETVQELSRQFDTVFTTYVQLTSAQGKRRYSSPKGQTEDDPA